MKIEVGLFGAFRQFQSQDRLELEVPEQARVADVRAAVASYGASHWPGFDARLLACSVFASATTILRDGEPVPPDAWLAVLPPVSGG